MTVVLDASAVLALILGEEGQERVVDAIVEGAVVSTINFAEVVARLARSGWTSDAIADVRDNLAVEFRDVDLPTAVAAGEVVVQTRLVGLSLGDRICLMLAKRLDATALTGDRKWLEVADALGVKVDLIR